jgi:hypothetical protein
MGKIDYNKDCRLIPLLTHVSFCCTIPLKKNVSLLQMRSNSHWPLLALILPITGKIDYNKDSRLKPLLTHVSFCCTVPLKKNVFITDAKLQSLAVAGVDITNNGQN